MLVNRILQILGILLIIDGTIRIITGILAGNYLLATFGVLTGWLLGYYLLKMAKKRINKRMVNR